MHPGPPKKTDGNVGDGWLDYASATLDLWKKSSDGWTKVGSIKRVMPNGAGGGGGGGNNIEVGKRIQDSGDLPLSTPLSGSKPPPPFFDPSAETNEYLTAEKPGGTYPDGMPVWPPHDRAGNPIPNADYIYSNPYQLKWQHQYNTWVYECLQRIAAFHKNFDVIDGGNTINEDPDGVPIDWIVDGDNSPLSQSNGNITDGHYQP
jgi:hypothetical protein